jgi:hypothetical protein
MQHEEINDRQLNPFAFPPETNGRFNILVLAALMTALYLVSIVGMVLILRSEFATDGPGNIEAQQISDKYGDNPLILTDNEIISLANETMALYWGFIQRNLLEFSLILFYIPAIVVVAYIVYRLHPRFIRQRIAIQPLSDTFEPEMLQAVTTLANQAHVLSPAIIQIGGGIKDGNADARIFGFRKKYILRLGGRLRLVFRKNSKWFNALILHELAHVKNRDVGRFYFSRSIWITFVGMIIIPLTLAMILYRGWQIVNMQGVTAEQTVGNATLLGSGLVPFFQIAALLIVVWSIIRGLVRIREYYADWRTALWGARAHLEERLHARATEEWAKATKNRHTWLWQQWQRLWKTHPTAQQRLNILRDPLHLFQVSFDIPFFSGLLLALVMIGIPMAGFVFVSTAGPLIEILFWGLVRIIIEIPSPLDRMIFALLLFLRIGILLLFGGATLILLAYLVEHTLGLQVQRQAISDLLIGRPRAQGYLNLWQPALLLALGVEAGFWLVPGGIFMPRSLLMLVLTPVWLGIFTLLTWLWLVYVRALNRRILGTHAGNRPPQRKRWIIIACSIITLWTLHLPMLFSRFVLTGIGLYNPQMFPEAVIMPGSTPEEFFFFTFGFTTFVLLSLGLALAFIWMSISLGLAYVWQRTRKHQCPTCREISPHRIIVGQHCASCYSELAAWMYVDPERHAAPKLQAY